MKTTYHSTSAISARIPTTINWAWRKISSHPKLPSHLLQKCLALMLCLLWPISSLMSAPPTAVGQMVIATSNVNVRSTPAGSALGTQAINSHGTTTQGPTTASLGGVSYQWWRVSFTNGGLTGWVASTGLSVVTLNAPSVQTLAATIPQQGRTRLNGRIVSDGGSPVTTARFYFSTYGSSGPWDVTNVTPDGNGNIFADFNGITPGTTVHFYAYAANTVGSATGQILNTVVPINGPTVQTLSAVNDQAARVLRLRGQIVATNGNPITSTVIKWTQNGSQVVDTQSAIQSGNEFYISLRVPVGTTVSFWAEGSTSAGTNRGETLSAVAAAFAPDAPTLIVADSLGQQTSIRVRGRVIPGSYDGGAAVSDVDLWWEIEQEGVPFIWPSEPDYFTNVAYGATFTGNGFFEKLISGFAASTTVHFKARTVNSSGRSSGWSSEVYTTTPDPLGYRPQVQGAFWQDNASSVYHHGDADELMESGETATVRITVKNVGDEAGPEGVVTWLPTSDARLILHGVSTAELSPLEPDGTAEIAFLVTLKSGTPSGLSLPMNLRLIGTSEHGTITKDMSFALTTHGNSASDPMPPLELIEEEGSLCVSLPTWARSEWKLQTSLNLQSWTDVALPADTEGVTKYLPPTTADRGYFRLTAKP